ncbi:hypothetical protein CSKR_107751 [Clonorchis sinensis]|uniref:Uncharacterized protein n=1 Tax=Clonorchis sinensis TaxID=79923 RepID=A0A3R7JWA6_CLOSI|nr:hypothetical protein CSKR_107751 [Clonorchis sinensis]
MAGGFTPVKVILLVTLLLAMVLSIISLAITDFGWAKQSSKMQASLAFNIIGLLSIIAASIFFLILFFACQKLYKLFMVLVIVLTVISLISFSIATGTAYHPNNPSYGAWVLSAVWNSVLAIVISIIFLVMND